MSLRERALSASNAVLANDALKSAGSLNVLLMTVGEVRQLVVATAIRCLASSKTYWDRERKSLVHVDDGPTQMKAAAFLAAYTDGLPTNTTLAINVAASQPTKGASKDEPRRISGANGELTVEDAMQRSPALRQRMRAMLDAAEKAAGKQGDAIDVG